MSYCVMCGSPIPDGQSVCSMCYGDMDYGRDGYYREWAEEQDELERFEQLAAEQAAQAGEESR